jgi:hypothetical protein
MMSLLRRLTKLEAATGQLTMECTPDADRLRWIERLEEFPAEWLGDLNDDRIAEVRAVCRAVGMRVQSGELRTHLEIARELPDEAVQGMAALRYPALRMSGADSTTNLTRWSVAGTVGKAGSRSEIDQKTSHSPTD